MINIWKNQEGALVRLEKDEKGSWIDVRSASRQDLELLEKKYGIRSEHLQDIMDLDEQSRIEKEDEYLLLIMRVPFYDPDNEVAYYTAPVGIVLFSDRIVTVCQSDGEVLEELSRGRQRGFDPRNRSAFVLNLLGRAAIVFLRNLKDLNRRTNAIERELQRSVKNNELIQLLAIEKSLVFFTTSLKSNELVLEKLMKSRVIRLKEDEEELLEDVETDNRQAIEMANIYSDILAGMMDAFASVISNNLNMVLKRLTSISVILMLSTLVVSAFSMNVDSPLSGNPRAFWIIVGVAAVASLLGSLFIRTREPRRTVSRRKKRTAQAPVHHVSSR